MFTFTGNLSPDSSENPFYFSLKIKDAGLASNLKMRLPRCARNDKHQ